MDKHALQHTKELAARLTAEQVDKTSIACDERAQALLKVLTLLQPSTPMDRSGELGPASLARLGEHLAALLLDQPDDEAPIRREWQGIRSECDHVACRGASTRPQPTPRAGYRKVAGRGRLVATILRVVSDLAWLWRQCHQHAANQDTRTLPPGEGAASFTLFRQAPAGVESDLLFAAVNLIAAFHIRSEALKLAVYDTIPGDSAAEFFRLVEETLGPELRSEPAATAPAAEVPHEAHV